MTTSTRWNRHRIAFGLAGMMFVLAAAASFFADAGGHRAAGIIAAQAGMALCLAYGAARRHRLNRGRIG